jgi:hypothetical protein
VGQRGYRGQEEMSDVLSVTGWAGFTMLLRMESNLKLMNRLFLEFSIYYFRAVNRGYRIRRCRGSTVFLKTEDGGGGGGLSHMQGHVTLRKIQHTQS